MQTEASRVGSGIEPVTLTLVPDVPPEAYVGKRRKEYVEEVTVTEADYVDVSSMAPAEMPEGFAELIAQLRGEMDMKVADIEWRLKQVYEQKLRMATGKQFVDMVTVEDINDGVHRLTGYTLTQNSPTGGGTWASLHIVFKGVDYTVAGGSLTSAQKYAWFVKSAATAVTGTTANIVLSVGASMPTLGPEDALIFVNNAGVITSVLESSIPSALPSGIVTQANLAGDVTGVLAQIQSDLLNAQATADGAIVSYFQPTAPWATGTTQDPAKVGDVWYDSDDGGAFRWSGAGGTPANTWVRIADTDTAALAGKVGTKTTTYISTNASPPVAPAAAGGVPAGFTVGDLWMVTDQGNKFRRWSGTAWDDLLVGDGGLASGISGAKIGSGISASNVTTGTLTGSLVGTGINAGNVTTGTLTGSLVGTGINGANVTSGTILAGRIGAGVAGAALGSATGTVGTSQIATNAVTNAQIANGSVQPVNINAAFHILY